MKLLKKKSICIGLILTGIIALTIVVFLLINKYTLELSITDGETIYIEYEKDLTLPKVTAVYKGNILNRKGIEVEVLKEGEINLKELGSYNLKYTAEYKNKKVTASVTLVIEDKTPPVIELVSDSEHFTSPIAKYEEEGFSAIDNYDGDITSKVIREEKDGIVTYKVTDSSGNTSVAEREIVYKDVVNPDITLNDGKDITVAVGTEFVEPGYQAIDDCDGDITKNVEIEGSVNGLEFGEYTLIYRVKDSSGNLCEVERNVNVADITAPILNLNGEKTIYLKKGEPYIEAGFTANDSVDGELTSNVNISGGVNSEIVGNYSITYQVSDKAGNISTESRYIYVYEKQAEVNEINPGNKVVYLTFDDGPGAYTAQLLDILDKYGVKVTFFVTNQYPAYQNLIGEAHRRGHTIALHTYSHNYAIYSSEADYYNDLKLINDICVAQTGVQPGIVRFPGGTSNTISSKYCSGIMTALSQSLSYHGYFYCDWNVSSGDAGGTNSAAGVASNVINGIKNHDVSIVLQHDIKSYSVNAVEQILAWGLANGYTFLPMTENTPMIHQTPNN